jgi:hypothetical protein
MSKEPKQQTKTKAAEKAGLIFNPDAIKKKIKEYYASQEIPYSKVSGGHIAMAALLESAQNMISCKAKKEVALNKSGLREITREAMNSSLLRDKKEMGYFIVKAEEFNDKFDYSKQLPIFKEMETIYSEQKDTSFSRDAKNYMYFLLYTLFTNILITSSVLLEFSKSKSTNGLCIIFASKIEFPKSMSVVFEADIKRALKSYGESVEGKNDDDEGAEEGEGVEEGEGEGEAEEEPEPEEEKPKPVKAGPKANTTGAKPTVAGQKAGPNKKPEEVKETEKPKPKPKPNSNAKKTLEIVDDDDDDTPAEETVKPKEQSKKNSKQTSNKSTKK